MDGDKSRERFLPYCPPSMDVSPTTLDSTLKISIVFNVLKDLLLSNNTIKLVDKALKYNYVRVHILVHNNYCNFFHICSSGNISTLFLYNAGITHEIVVTS